MLLNVQGFSTIAPRSTVFRIRFTRLGEFDVYHDIIGIVRTSI